MPARSRTTLPTAGLADPEAVQVLRATWIQQFYLHSGQVRWRDKQTGLPPAAG